MCDNYGDDSGKLGKTTQLVGCARDAHAVENLKVSGRIGYENRIFV